MKISLDKLRMHPRSHRHRRWRWRSVRRRRGQRKQLGHVPAPQPMQRHEQLPPIRAPIRFPVNFRAPLTSPRSHAAATDPSRPPRASPSSHCRRRCCPRAARGDSGFARGEAACGRARAVGDARARRRARAPVPLISVLIARDVGVRAGRIRA